MAVARGRGCAFVAIASGLLFALQCCSWHASATNWTVGDSQGWNVGVNYTNWTSDKTFRTNDILFFAYTQGQHDVVVVNQSEYDSCTWTNQIINYTAGNTNVTLNATGTHYYLCSISTHCSQGGMKLAVTVTAGGPPGSNTSTTPPPPPPPSCAPYFPATAALATLLVLAATVLAL